jgi:hypothetical protein
MFCYFGKCIFGECDLDVDWLSPGCMLAGVVLEDHEHHLESSRVEASAVVKQQGDGKPVQPSTSRMADLMCITSVLLARELWLIF